MPIALITGPQDLSDTRAEINGLIDAINTEIAGIAGVIDFGSLPSGAAPDGTEPGAFLQNAVVVALTVDQLRTSASGVNPGDNGVNMYFRAGDGVGSGYGGTIYLYGGAGGATSSYGGGVQGNAGYGYYTGGETAMRAGASYYQGGNAILQGGYGYGSVGGNVRLTTGGAATPGNIIFTSVPPVVDPSIAGAIWVSSVTGALYRSP